MSEWSVLPASPSHPPFLPFVPDVHSYPINAPLYYLSIAFDDLGGASESGKGTGVEKQRLETRYWYPCVWCSVGWQHCTETDWGGHCCAPPLLPEHFYFFFSSLSLAYPDLLPLFAAGFQSLLNPDKHTVSRVLLSLLYIVYVMVKFPQDYVVVVVLLLLLFPLCSQYLRRPITGQDANALEL